ncbi:MAG: oligosaccharide repeat unit polymerase [Gammaproteobacteria bacterium]|nr:oligosaccharide repeat unit polymerase [Gammaproteobacteria bacterium]
MTSIYWITTAGAGTDIISLYALYLILNSIIFYLHRRELLAPPSLYSMICFASFGFNIPLIISGFVGDIHISESALYKVVIIVLLSQTSFVIGCYSGLYRIFPITWIVLYRGRSRDTSIQLFVIILLIVIGAGYYRINFHLGEAGVQPTIQYAGIHQYLLFDGVLLLCLWYLAKSLCKNRFYIILALLLLLSMVFVQALLGWRGAIVEILIITAVVFWYQLKSNNNNKRRSYSFLWLLLPLMFVSSMMQLGNTIRTERLGGEQEYAKTKEDLVLRIFRRTQGTTRLSAVLEHFGSLTFTNDYLVKHLYDKNISNTIYIDRNVYGILPYQSHSVGASGPGGAYTSIGMIGVFACYLLLGAIYQSCYSNIIEGSKKETNALSIVLYAYMAVLMQSMMSENFSMNDVNNIIAVCFSVYLIKIGTQKR